MPKKNTLEHNFGFCLFGICLTFAGFTWFDQCFFSLYLRGKVFCRNSDAAIWRWVVGSFHLTLNVGMLSSYCLIKINGILSLSICVFQSLLVSVSLCVSLCVCLFKIWSKLKEDCVLFFTTTPTWRWRHTAVWLKSLKHWYLMNILRSSTKKPWSCSISSKQKLNEQIILKHLTNLLNGHDTELVFFKKHFIWLMRMGDCWWNGRINMSPINI